MSKIYDSIDDYTKDELLAVAEQFGTEVKSSISKRDLVTRLEEDGINVEIIQAYKADTEEDLIEAGLQPLAPTEVIEAPAAAPVEEEDDNLVLVKMTRHNYTYEVRGHRFTREHPFALVTEEDAEYLTEVEGGFRYASPKEAREYYS